jgi:peptidoglycan/xylan/chitin deacetylase (PgdA/CDA1 family)
LKLIVSLLFLFGLTPSNACQNTQQIIEINSEKGFFTGQVNYADSLNLKEKQLILTFDDGPLPGWTDKVLTILSKHCIKATFFLVGQMAHSAPHLVERIKKEGHTIGHHSNTHPMTLGKMNEQRALDDMEKGFKAVDLAAHQTNFNAPATPFFRYPGFGDSNNLNEYLKKRQIAVFGAEIWIYDWLEMTRDQQLFVALKQIEKHKKGIVLFHDTRAQMVNMLDELLETLIKQGYSFVHLVPAKNDNFLQ